MPSTPPETRFKLNEQIVYPLQGVGKIITLSERPFKDKMIWYYTIYLEISDMTVMVPVDKAEQLGIRAIVPQSLAEEALALISQPDDVAPTDWKQRYQMNHDLLKQGSVADIAKVVRTLYHRSKIKELPVMERKLFDSATKLLVDEISLSLGKPKTEVEALIFSKLEKDIPVTDKKGMLNDFGFDDDEGLMDDADSGDMGATANNSRDEEEEEDDSED
jgi:CarD family transcriptional regulator